MSCKSKLIQSRNQWKNKAGQRAGKNRYLTRELNRIKNERDAFSEELKQTKARLRQLEARSQGFVVQHKVELIFLALQLFLVARIGFRAVSRVLSVLAVLLGIKKPPCPQTIINWVTRLSLVRIQSASSLRGLPMECAQFCCNGLIWMIDMSIGLGTGKILTVLALEAHHHQLAPSAPGFQNVRCVAVSVADSWTGVLIASFLERLIAVMGRPAAYLKDGGADLKRAIRLLGDKGLASPSIDDISHVIANLLKHWYCDHPMFETFLSTCGRVAGKLKQTILACLAPPKVHTKARFMNVHRLIAWADRLLKLSPPGAAKAGSVLSKLRSSLDELPSCKTFIKRFLSDAVPLLKCQQILKTKGLSYTTLTDCDPLIQSIPSAGVRRDFLSYLHRQLDLAKALGLEKIGLPISSDQLESLYGLAKQHGVGQIKDADQIAIRLPTLCGIPTRAEAEQVLGISVADQNKITGSFTSLIKQRREVFSNPDRLHILGADQVRPHVELIPSAKKQSKNPEIFHLSASYPNQSGPNPVPQNGCHSP